MNIFKECIILSYNCSLFLYCNNGCTFAIHTFFSFDLMSQEFKLWLLQLCYFFYTYFTNCCHFYKALLSTTFGFYFSISWLNSWNIKYFLNVSSSNVDDLAENSYFWKLVGDVLSPILCINSDKNPGHYNTRTLRNKEGWLSQGIIQNWVSLIISEYPGLGTGEAIKQ